MIYMRRRALRGLRNATWRPVEGHLVKVDGTGTEMLVQGDRFESRWAREKKRERRKGIRERE